MILIDTPKILAGEGMHWPERLDIEVPLNSTESFYLAREVYTEPTESPVSKLEAFGDLYTDITKSNGSLSVLCPVGVNWPGFYVGAQAQKCTAMDINLAQLKVFATGLKTLPNNNPLHIGFAKEDYKLIYGDLTARSNSLKELISEHNLVDLSNILDYVPRQMAVDILIWYIDNLPVGGVLTLSTMYWHLLFDVQDYFVGHLSKLEWFEYGIVDEVNPGNLLFHEEHVTKFCAIRKRQPIET